MAGKGGNNLTVAARLIAIAVGMFLLFGIAMELLKISLALFSVLLLYLVYCGYILPGIDRRRGAPGAAETALPGTGRSDRFSRLRAISMFLTITVVSFLFLASPDHHDARVFAQPLRILPRLETGSVGYHLREYHRAAPG